ncbi:hypothetical protein DSO57_1007627 [Entomophthora muscae]|uniref:Uncharacterized protein n=1 Tax=Entomophthora muscae TaxID=34485 RepID=A0ACC2TV33_9FUNG|nr:hypothetical protein DSO57_1007627 [Entomophthora muscae]
MLPLSPSAKLLITGPASDSLRQLSGGWSYTWLGAPDDSYFSGRGISILSGFQKLSSGKITHVDTSPEEIIAMSGDYDAIVVCVGEEPYTEFEGDINNMYLPSSQLKLLDTLIEQSNNL